MLDAAFAALEDYAEVLAQAAAGERVSDHEGLNGEQLARAAGSALDALRAVDDEYGVTEARLVTSPEPRLELRVVDPARIADAHGAVISAPLFGALAGSGVLPFPPAAFERAIERGGKGVARSLAAFAAAMQREARPFEMMLYPGQTHRVGGPGVSAHLWRTILSFLDREVKNAPAQPVAAAGGGDGLPHTVESSGLRSASERAPQVRVRPGQSPRNRSAPGGHLDGAVHGLQRANVHVVVLS